MMILTTFLIGFSIISAILLAVTHFNCAEYRGKLLSRTAGFVLLSGLALLQYSHYKFLQADVSYVYSFFYIILLFSVAPAFYFFSRDVLKVNNSPQLSQPYIVLHAVPSLLALFLPRDFALPLAFFVGTGYVAWLAYSVYTLREQRSRFKLELLALGAMFVVASMVLLLGVALPVISEDLFYSTYATLIGLAFVVALFTVLSFPNITTDVADAA